jgi:1,2-diacylglycerol 3-beta-galactosyltransferase
MVSIAPRPAREVAELLPAHVAMPQRSPGQAGTASAGGRVPLLFLLADTGGGHRSAARAVGEALEAAYPGRFDPVLCDPLAGPGASRLLRWVTRRYGPLIRFAPWAWGAVYYACDSHLVMRLVQRTLLTLADRPVAQAMAAHGPAAIVSFHPLTGGAAARVRRRQHRDIPVLTVVTDLTSAHAAWRLGPADRYVTTALPVTSGFWRGPPPEAERAALRRALGLDESCFLAILTGGAEGAGGLARRAATVLASSADIQVVAVCGRNLRLRRRLARLAAGAGGRLTVLGFVDNMPDWLRSADVVIAKAGPGTIAEAACCGLPLLLTSHLPGQEKDNARLVTRAGAGRVAAGRRQLARELAVLRRDPAALAAMGAASARLGQPGAAAAVATLLASLTEKSVIEKKAGTYGSGR